MDALRSRSTNLIGQLLLGLAIFALLALVGRLVYIHGKHGDQLLARAARQQQSNIPIKHRRGLIVDSRGRIISGTLLRKSVFADLAVLPDREDAGCTVARILGHDPAELSQDFISAGDQRFMVIQRAITAEQEALIEQADLYGIGTFDEPYRTYPMGCLAGAVVGFVSPDGAGVSGLEFQCDGWLRGDDGMKTIVRDVRRRAFWLAEGGYRPSRHGLHLILTLDSELQAIAERELNKAVDQFKAQGGAAIVMHPASGAILAMANAPVFDPNNYRDYGTDRYRNRAITDPFEPGSTFKPFIAAPALAEGVVEMGEVFDCESGSWDDAGRTLHDAHPHDFLAFEDVVAESSNIGMAKIGKRLGNKTIHHYVKAFGFGEKTGIDLTGEDAGIVRHLAKWNTYSTLSLSIGQEIAVTPLQLARAFCAFANGGRLVRPYVIRAVMGADGRVINDFTRSEPGEQIIPEEIAATMRGILSDAVNVGTGGKAALPNYQVFGKTGTAQIARKGGGGYEPDAYVGSFVCGAPASDPKLVVLVCITRPQKSLGYYGGTVAAPAAGAILAHSLAYLHVPPDKQPEEELTAALPAVD